MKHLFISFLLIFYVEFTYGQNEIADSTLYGISAFSGQFNLDGDIDGNGYAYGLRFQMPIEKLFSIRANLMTASANGYSAQPWLHSSVSNAGGLGGGLSETVFEPYRNNQDGWFPSYKFSQTSLELEGVISFTNIINYAFTSNIHFIDVYAIGSVGAGLMHVNLDLLGADNKPYTSLIEKTGFSSIDFDTKSGQERIRNEVKKIYDGVYESNFDLKPLRLFYSNGIGLSFRISKQFDIGAEYKNIYYPNFDYADAIKFYRTNVPTRDDDKSSMISVFLRLKI
jgi:hypothetical protein